MADPDPDRPGLEDIDARLRAIRSRREGERRPKPTSGRWQGTEVAWRMVIDLTAGVAVGCAIGWGLDVLLGTKPLFILVFILLGFAAGVRIMLQSARDLQRRNRAAAEPAKADGDGDGADAPQDGGR